MTQIKNRKTSEISYEWDMDFLKTGMEIKKRRVGMHLSQDRMLDALWDIGVSVSKNSLSSWDNGEKATLSHLLALCYIFHCTLDELVILNPRSRSEDEEDQLLFKIFTGKKAKSGYGLLKIQLWVD